MGVREIDTDRFIRAIIWNVNYLLRICFIGFGGLIVLMHRLSVQSLLSFLVFEKTGVSYLPYLNFAFKVTPPPPPHQPPCSTAAC